MSWPATGGSAVAVFTETQGGGRRSSAVQCGAAQGGGGGAVRCRV